MKIGFIGLGNVGGKLAKSLLRNNFELTVRDLDQNLTENFKELGAKVEILLIVLYIQNMSQTIFMKIKIILK